MAKPDNRIDSENELTVHTADCVLISCIQHGTPEQRCLARRIIYEKYQEYLKNYIRKHTKSDEDTKEIFSNTWLTATEKLPSFEWRIDTESKKPLRSWLSSIATFKIKEYFRQEETHYCLDNFILAKLGAKTTMSQRFFDEDGDKNRLKAQANRRLHKVIKKLNMRDQKIITLYYFKSMNFAEIGRVLKMTEGAVRVRHHRLLPRLKKHLQEGVQ